MSTKSLSGFSGSPSKEHFLQHVTYFQKQLDLLKQFKMPNIRRWKIDWSSLDAIANSGQQWSELQIYNSLKKSRKLPGIYYFTSSREFSNEVYRAFVAGKFKSSKYRINNGLNHDEFINICHVPKNYKETFCLYVMPNIYFNYCFFESRFFGIKEHIERMFQDHNNPLIGQKAFKNIPRLCLCPK